MTILGCHEIDFKNMGRKPPRLVKKGPKKFFKRQGLSRHEWRVGEGGTRSIRPNLASSSYGQEEKDPGLGGSK